MTLGSDCGIKTHVFQTLINYHEASDRRCTFVGNRVLPIEVDNSRVNLTLIDTSGLEQYENMHSLMYGNSVNCVILCFNSTSEFEYRSAITTWLNASREMCPKDCHFVLCGVQCGPKEDAGNISETQILDEIRNLPITFYRKVLYEENVAEMFDDIVRLCNGQRLKLQGYSPGHWVSITYQQKEYLAAVKTIDESRQRMKLFYLGKPFRWSNHEWIRKNDMHRVKPKTQRQILQILCNESQLVLCLDVIVVVCGFLETTKCFNMVGDRQGALQSNYKEKHDDRNAIRLLQ